MSKLTKLINNPSLFFRDFFDKRLGSKKSSALPQKPKPVKKATPKPKAPAKAINIDLSAVNFYRDIKLILHSGESLAAGANQIIPWIPVFVQAKVDFVVVVRNEAFYKWIRKEYPWLSVAFARRGVDIEDLINLLPNAKAVFYPSSTGNNIHIVRFNHLEHIFIGHGDSDKASSAHKALRLYDVIWTAGQAHIDRFKNSDFYTGHLQFLKVGRPNLSSVINNCQDDWRERMSPKILYLPTWEGVVEETNYSSTNFSGEIMREVNKQLNIPIDVKYHPFTGNRNSLIKNIGKMTEECIINEGLNSMVVHSEVELKNIIPNYNLYICDISGVVTECLAADGPIFVYIPEDRDIKIASSDMKYEDYCYTYSSTKELLRKLEAVLAGDDHLADNRKEAIQYFIGKNETIDNFFIKKLITISES